MYLSHEKNVPEEIGKWVTVSDGEENALYHCSTDESEIKLCFTGTLTQDSGFDLIFKLCQSDNECASETAVEEFMQSYEPVFVYDVV